MNTAATKEMVEYYDCRAAEYDHSMGYGDPAAGIFYEPIIQFLRQKFCGRDVLEIACGPGYWTQQIADVATSVLATDVNQSVLEQAGKKVFSKRNVEFRQADVYKLPDFGKHRKTKGPERIP